MTLHAYPNPNEPEYCVISDNPVFGVFNDEEMAIASRWEDIPALITALRRAYNNRPVQSQADGVVASVLLQSAVAEAPGDFS